MILDTGIICPNRRIGCPNCRLSKEKELVTSPGDHSASELPQTHPRKKVREFQRCVFKTAANRAAPVREAVISVPTRSRSRTR